MIKNLESHPLIIPIAEVIAKAISFINILLMIRIFSIDEYADYSYIISVILWASVLMDGGINDLIYNKSLHKDSSKLNQLFNSKIYLSFIVIICLFFYFYYNEPSLVFYALILSFVIFFSSLTALFKMYSRGNGIISVDFKTIITEPLIRFLFLLVIYYLISINLWQFFLVYLFASFLAFSYNYYSLSQYYKFKLKFEKFQVIFKNITTTLSSTKFFFLYYLMFIGVQRLDIILIEKYSSKENLALFSTAITLFQVAFLFYYSLLTSKFIMFFKNKNNLYKYLLPSILSIVILSQFISPIIYKFLFPKEYLKGYLAFNVIILSLIPSVFSLYFILKNNYKGRTIENLYILSFILILKFFIYYYLQSKNIELYYFTYVAIEILLMLIFLINNIINESSSNK